MVPSHTPTMWIKVRSEDCIQFLAGRQRRVLTMTVKGVSKNSGLETDESSRIPLNPHTGHLEGNHLIVWEPVCKGEIVASSAPSKGQTAEWRTTRRGHPIHWCHALQRRAAGYWLKKLPMLSYMHTYTVSTYVLADFFSERNAAPKVRHDKTVGSIQHETCQMCQFRVRVRVSKQTSHKETCLIVYILYNIFWSLLNGANPEPTSLQQYMPDVAAKAKLRQSPNGCSSGWWHAAFQKVKTVTVSRHVPRTVDILDILDYSWLFWNSLVVCGETRSHSHSLHVLACGMQSNWCHMALAAATSKTNFGSRSPVPSHKKSSHQRNLWAFETHRFLKSGARLG